MLATSAIAPTAHTPRAIRDLPRFGERPLAPVVAAVNPTGERPGGEYGGDDAFVAPGFTDVFGAAFGAGHFDGGDIGDMHTV